MVNVGAGAGSYEPRSLTVFAVEPSEVMAAQRPADLPPAIIASAEELPLDDASVDAAMAILTIHHWDDAPRGIAQMRRVSRGPLVILTVDTDIANTMWLMRDYLPVAVRERDAREFPAIASLLDWLGPAARSEVVPVPADCRDGFLLAFWSRPEAVLDPAARAATSAFARMIPAHVDALVARLRNDLERGAWDARNGHLRHLTELDVGLRLVIADGR